MLNFGFNELKLSAKEKIMSALPPPDEGRELRTVGFFVTVEFLAKAHKIYEVFVLSILFSHYEIYQLEMS